MDTDGVTFVVVYNVGTNGGHGCSWCDVKSVFSVEMAESLNGSIRSMLDMAS